MQSILDAQQVAIIKHAFGDADYSAQEVADLAMLLDHTAEHAPAMSAAQLEEATLAQLHATSASRHCARDANFLCESLNA